MVSEINYFFALQIFKSAKYSQLYYKKNSNEIKNGDITRHFSKCAKSQISAIDRQV
jgi:hypothetical protein